jgi:hypothetical protein
MHIINAVENVKKGIAFPFKNLGPSKSPPKNIREKAKKKIEDYKVKLALARLFVLLHIRNKLDDSEQVKILKSKAREATKYFENADYYMILDEIVRGCYYMDYKTCKKYKKYPDKGATVFLKNYKRMAYANDLYNKYINDRDKYQFKKNSPKKSLLLEKSLSNISEYGSSYHSARSDFSQSSNKGGMAKKSKKIKKNTKIKKNKKK